MARLLTSVIRDEVQDEEVEPVLIAKLEFSGKAGDVRVWTGVGDLTFDGETYTGIGNLGGIGAVEETTELRATGLAFTMSGIPSSQISLALSEEFQQRRATLWLGFFDSSVSPGLLNDPVIIFRGRMDTMDIVPGPETSVVTINAESIFMALERAPMRRYMPEDHNVDSLIVGAQKFIFYDKGFDFVANIQDAQIYWGGPGPTND